MAFRYSGVSILFAISYMTASIPDHVKTAPVGNDTINNRPIIGILAQRYSKVPSKAYIAASYVKFAEAAGARVVPIMNNLSEDELLKLYNSINGVIFPGGDSSLSKSGYGKTGKQLFLHAKTANAKGDYFPLLGICLGCQLLSYLVAGKNPLNRTDSSHIDLKLKYTPETANSRLFKDMDPSLKERLQEEAISYNNHKFSVLVDTFNANSNLKSFYKNLATSEGRKGLEFVAAMEGKLT